MLVTVNWFEYLLQSMPKGQFYYLGDRHSRGTVLPYQDDSYEIDFLAEANHTYKVTKNGSPLAPITTDANGRAIITLPPALEAGPYEIQISDTVSGATIRLFYDIKHLATILAAYAKVLQDLDDEILDIDAAKSLRTVGPKYIEPSYGLALHQTWPTGYLTSDYRNLLKALRPAYRQFGGTHLAVKQAVSAMTSVSPLIVPKAWRSSWVLGEQLLPSGELDQWTRVSEAMWAPAGHVNELPTLNRQSKYWIIPSVTAATTTGFRAIPLAQKITITNNSGANTVYATVTGLDENGLAVAERIPSSGTIAIGATQASSLLYTEISSVTPTGTSPNIAVGLGESRFIKVLSLGSFNSTSPTEPLYLTYLSRDDDGNARLTWAAGPEATPQDNETVTLHDRGRYPKVFGIKTVAANFSFDPVGNTNPVEYHNRLHLRIKDGAMFDGSILVSTTDTTAADTVANTAANIETALTAVYGSGVDPLSVALQGTEGAATDYFLRLSSENPPSNVGVSSIEILPGPADAAPHILGLPKSTSVVASFPSTTEIECESTANMPLADFDIRVRGLKIGETVATLAFSSAVYAELTDYAPGSPDGQTRAVLASAPFNSTATQIGGYIRLIDGTTAANNGLHRIIGYTATGNFPILLHESGTDAFIGTAILADPPQWDTHAVTVAYFDPGTVHTVVENDTATNTLTLDAATPLDGVWDAALKPIVDVLALSPYRIEETEAGPGTITVRVDHDYRPLHDFGDSITFVSGNDWTLSSARADFSAIGASDIIHISGTEHESNSGAFPVVSATATTVTYTNVNGSGSALTNESSDSIEWWFDAGWSSIDIRDSVVPEGPDVPDDVVDFSDCSMVMLSNHDPYESVTGRDGNRGELAVSKMWFESAAAECSIEFKAPKILEHKGLPVTVNAWVQEGHTDNTPYKIYFVDTDNACVEEIASATVPMLPVDTRETFWAAPASPTCVSGTFYVPWDTSSAAIRIARETPGPFATPETFAIEKVTVACLMPDSLALGSTGYTLGEETIPRTAKRTDFGSLLYVWSARPLEDEEKTFLGLSTDGPQDSIVTRLGHIDRVTANHAYWDRLEVSEYDPADEYTPENVRGMYTDEEFDTCTLRNLEVVMGTPARLSYVRPIDPTLIESESLTMVDGGDAYPAAARATLLHESCHSGAYPQDPNTDVGTLARLYEVRAADYSYRNADGRYTIIPAGERIPLPDTADENGDQAWEFTAADEIRVNSPYFDVDQSYVLDYEKSTQITTPVFQLDPGTGIVVDDYVWLADLAMYVRHETEVLKVLEEVGVDFQADFRATLRYRADIASGAKLYQDNGTSKILLNSRDWEWIDSRTIKIDPSVFDNTSLYSLDYTMALPNPAAVPNVVFEWRWAESEVAVDGEAWAEIEDGQPLSPVVLTTPDLTVNSAPPWVQFRATISNVVSIEDIRIYGIGMKGLPLT